MAIYDCFTFYNEFELLELRLQTLYDVVDYFVIVESNKTHRNVPKNFNFEARKSEFAKYLPKIRYIKEKDVVPYKGLGDWSLENHQRNCIMRGLFDAHPNDYVFISDLDEIPRPDLIQRLEHNELQIHFFGHQTLLDRRLKKYRRINRVKFALLHPYSLFVPMTNRVFLEYSPLVCEQTFYCYFMNCRSKARWYGTILVLFKNLKRPQELRNIRNRIPRVENAGWHFSYMGGAERIMMKLNSIVDGNPALAKKEIIEQTLHTGQDLYGRHGAADFEFEFCSLESLDIEHLSEFLNKHPQFYHS
jgi:beta-1,4-mannosyl-glycoprotein beta-1,4-N-acetylglucosaminyltransferase